MALFLLSPAALPSICSQFTDFTRQNTNMSAQTRAQMVLHYDSGSILYRDAEDEIVFYIESHGVTPNEPEEEQEEIVELAKHFLRQHLIKNGERNVAPLMKGNCLKAILKAVVDMHLEKDAEPTESLGNLYKILGVLVSTLERRTHALAALEEMQKRQQQESGDV